MGKKNGLIIVTIVLLFMLSGCQTSSKQIDVDEGDNNRLEIGDVVVVENNLEVEVDSKQEFVKNYDIDLYDIIVHNGGFYKKCDSELNSRLYSKSHYRLGSISDDVDKSTINDMDDDYRATFLDRGTEIYNTYYLKPDKLLCVVLEGEAIYYVRVEDPRDEIDLSLEELMEGFDKADYHLSALGKYLVEEGYDSLPSDVRKRNSYVNMCRTFVEHLPESELESITRAWEEYDTVEKPKYVESINQKNLAIHGMIQPRIIIGESTLSMTFSGFLPNEEQSYQIDRKVYDTSLEYMGELLVLSGNENGLVLEVRDLMWGLLSLHEFKNISSLGLNNAWIIPKTKTEFYVLVEFSDRNELYTYQLVNNDLVMKDLSLNDQLSVEMVATEVIEIPVGKLFHHYGMYAFQTNYDDENYLCITNNEFELLRVYRLDEGDELISFTTYEELYEYSFRVLNDGVVKDHYEKLNIYIEDRLENYLYSDSNLNDSYCEDSVRTTDDYYRQKERFLMATIGDQYFINYYYSKLPDDKVLPDNYHVLKQNFLIMKDWLGNDVSFNAVANAGSLAYLRGEGDHKLYESNGEIITKVISQEPTSMMKGFSDGVAFVKEAEPTKLYIRTVRGISEVLETGEEVVDFALSSDEIYVLFFDQLKVYNSVTKELVKSIKVYDLYSGKPTDILWTGINVHENDTDKYYSLKTNLFIRYYDNNDELVRQIDNTNGVLSTDKSYYFKTYDFIQRYDVFENTTNAVASFEGGDIIGEIGDYLCQECFILNPTFYLINKNQRMFTDVEADYVLYVQETFQGKDVSLIDNKTQDIIRNIRGFDIEVELTDNGYRVRELLTNLENQKSEWSEWEYFDIEDPKTIEIIN